MNQLMSQRRTPMPLHQASLIINPNTQFLQMSKNTTTWWTSRMLRDSHFILIMKSTTWKSLIVTKFSRRNSLLSIRWIAFFSPIQRASLILIYQMRWVYLLKTLDNLSLLWELLLIFNKWSTIKISSNRMSLTTWPTSKEELRMK